MTEKLKSYLRTWWKPLLTFLLATGIYVGGLMLESKFVYDFFPWIVPVLMVVVFASAVYQVIIKKWYFGLLQLAILFGAWFVLSVLVSFYPNDFFADNLGIPDDIAFEEPLDLRTDVGMDPKNIGEVMATRQNDLTFKIANGTQSGIYDYYFWHRPKTLGTLYLKAFEVTQNLELSTERLQMHSEVEIKQLNETVELFTNGFTIYEGDWGQPYGARFEVWFKPDNGEPERKLTEKNYIIEGWMR